VIAKHLRDPAPDPRAANPGLSVAAAEIVSKAMAKDRDERYASASALLADVEDALAQGVRSPTGTETTALARVPQSKTSFRGMTTASKPVRRKRPRIRAGAWAVSLSCVWLPWPRSSC
jgi:hypothetical protein